MGYKLNRPIRQSIAVKQDHHSRLKLQILALLLVLISAFVSMLTTPASANQANPQEILLGMSTALTGPAKSLGINMLLGVNMRLEQENLNGGVRGVPLRMIALDDGYEPSRTAPNMRNLIERDKVLAVIGNVGTPTAIAAVPVANEKQTLFFAPFTGAGMLRLSPPDRYIMNYRASYAEETSAMVDALIKHAGFKPEEIAFFTQRDGYGDAGFVGGMQALESHGLTLSDSIVHGRYERNTLSVENGLADILMARTIPKAIIMVGAYAPCARFIQLARASNVDALFLNVSFVGSAPLAHELGGNAKGVIVTQVVPHHNDLTLPIVQEYREALQKYAPDADPSFGSLEGYIATSVLMKALFTIEGMPTRESIIDALESLGEFDIGVGHDLSFSKTNHQASHKVWPSILENGKFVDFDWSQIKSFI